MSPKSEDFYQNDLENKISKAKQSQILPSTQNMFHPNHNCNNDYRKRPA